MKYLFIFVNQFGFSFKNNKVYRAIYIILKDTQH